MYQFISHPASYTCCGGAKIEIDPKSWQGFGDAENAISPDVALANKLFVCSQVVLLDYRKVNLVEPVKVGFTNVI